MSSEPINVQRETHQVQDTVPPALRIYDPEGLGGRDVIRDGDVFAFKYTRPEFWSAAIRLESHSPFSHVGFAIKIRGVLYVLEAKELVGVRLFPLARYLADPAYEVHWFRLRADEFRLDRYAIVDSALHSLGDAYASPWQFLRSFGWLTRGLADRLGVPRIVNRRRYFCSNYILAKLRTNGYHADARLSAIQASPGDITLLTCLEPMGRVA